MKTHCECTQCGGCCKAEVCLIGEILLETKTAPCPALIFLDDKYWCGAVLYADSVWPGIGLSDHLAYLLGIGKGCDTQPTEADATELLSRMLEFEEKLKSTVECGEMKVTK